MGLDHSDRDDATPARLLAWRLPIVIAAIALLVAAIGDPGREVLAWSRPEIGAGELWRLVTGHLVHLGFEHLLMNLAGLALTWYLVADYLTEPQWLFVVGADLVAIDLGFWVFDPQLAWYVGLSGLLHGLLVAGTVAGWRRGRPELRVLAVLVVAKIVYEQWLGPLPGSEATAGGAVIVDAHAYGAAGGLAAAVLILIRVRARASI